MEVEPWDLELNVKQYFYNIHNMKSMFPTQERILHGWYVRKALKVKFYYTPSWFSRQRMYWFHGWKWVPVDDEA